MDTAIEDIRALLWQFQKAGLRDFHLRNAGLEVFFARTDGAANPILAAAAPGSPAEVEEPAAMVSAPHLGFFEPCCAVGDLVAPGSLVAQIDVLGRKTDVFSNDGGRILALGFAANDLVEYGDSLFSLAAA